MANKMTLKEAGEQGAKFNKDQVFTEAEHLRKFHLK
jgi:hypothetical protein